MNTIFLVFGVVFGVLCLAALVAWGAIGWRELRSEERRANYFRNLADEYLDGIHRQYGDHYHCLGCGHDCPTAQACTRNNYGHQKRGELGEPCSICVAAMLVVGAAQREAMDGK